MKKILPILLLISATIISASIDELSISDNLSEFSNSTKNFRNNKKKDDKKSVTLSFPNKIKQEDKIDQKEILRLINIKKEEAFHINYITALKNHDTTNAKIIAKKEAKRIYNFEYKQSQKRKRLEIIIPENTKFEYNNTDFINNPTIKWIYNDDDHKSPINKQYPTIIQRNNHKIKNINAAKFDIEIDKLLALIPELSHA